MGEELTSDKKRNITFLRVSDVLDLCDVGKLNSPPLGSTKPLFILFWRVPGAHWRTSRINLKQVHLRILNGQQLSVMSFCDVIERCWSFLINHNVKFKTEIDQHELNHLCSHRNGVRAASRTGNSGKVCAAQWRLVDHFLSV